MAVKKSDCTSGWERELVRGPDDCCEGCGYPMDRTDDDDAPQYAYYRWPSGECACGIGCVKAVEQALAMGWNWILMGPRHSTVDAGGASHD
jgi:hypothetical protein